jgi:hypothetical protein
MIEYSVVLPMYRSKYIGWLALESLCRQVKVKHQWELVVAEDLSPGEVFGKEALLSYRMRLSNVGCTNITYIPLKKWVPLCAKICLLHDNCSKSSKYAMFQSADYYSSPHIVHKSYRVLSENPDYDWFGSTPTTIFYDIETGIAKMVPNTAQGSGRVVKLSLAKLVKPAPRKKGCDKWFWNNCLAELKAKEHRSIRVFNDNEVWRSAFNVNGFHNCTLKRTARIRQDHPKWVPVNFDWKSNIPKDILKMVEDSKVNLSKHKLGINKY